MTPRPRHDARRRLATAESLHLREDRVTFPTLLLLKWEAVASLSNQPAQIRDPSDVQEEASFPFLLECQTFRRKEGGVPPLCTPHPR